ncbi:MAG: PaaI family thioesterase [Crocinitomicaceae bacterium]
MIRNIPSIKAMNSMNKNTLMEVLSIEYTNVGEDFVEAKMPVNSSTHQPMGLLHGGASAALIESIASIGSALCVDLNLQAVVGLELNANHLKSASTGFIYARGELIHCGKTTHLWQVNIRNEENEMVCTGRLTVMVINRK